MSRYYDRQGQPLPRTAAYDDGVWSLEARRVADDIVGDYRVSTVHLVIDHSHTPGPPLIFETMVFQKSEDLVGDEMYCERYATEAEATAGHTRIVAAVKAGSLLDRGAQ